MKEGPLNRHEQFDLAISDFVSQYEDLQSSLGTLEPEQITIINNKIVELDTRREQTQSKEVRAYITVCMERLAAIVVSQMPEKNNNHTEEAPSVDEEIRYNKAA